MITISSETDKLITSLPDTTHFIIGDLFTYFNFKWIWNVGNITFIKTIHGRIYDKDY